jgi:hypothetical protein
MSLQVTVGANSLLALGLGAGDIFSLVSLSRTIGNWWTASSGDDEFLGMLNEDEFSILRRRGLIDLPSFNKRWRRKMRFLANGSPQCVEGGLAQDATKELTRFTASMVCIVAAVDQFTSLDVVKEILRTTLKALLQTSAFGDDYLKSQYLIRLNAWRSTATLHGFDTEASSIRQDMLHNRLILPGTAPVNESHHINEFLTWLLSGHSEEFNTASSDVAGIAVCLNHLGFDTLAVHGMDSVPARSNCRLIYTPNPILTERTKGSEGQLRNALLFRASCTTVPLNNPQECISAFPVSSSVHNRCRSAWRLGENAAHYVTIGVCGVDDRSMLNQTMRGRLDHEDILYVFTDHGSDQQRISEELYNIAEAHAFVVNEQILEGLRDCLGRETRDTLTWVLDKTKAEFESDPSLDEQQNIVAFTVFQSFFMAYYYQIFRSIVDTSSLQIPIVEGAWGFRSPDTLTDIRRWIKTLRQPFNRQELIPILSSLFLNHDVDIPVVQDSLTDSRKTLCVGIIAKRTLLTNSMLGKCSSPKLIASFTLLDVDVGGVPRNRDGIIRSGNGDVFPGDIEVTSAPTPDGAEIHIQERSPPEDVSLHIEADWEGDPNTALLCVRYHGRRIVSICSAKADKAFIGNYLPSRARSPKTSTKMNFMTTGIESWLSSPAVIISRYATVPILFQALNRPQLRYVASAIYQSCAQVRIASDSIAEALEKAQLERIQRESRIGQRARLSSMVIVGSDVKSAQQGEDFTGSKNFLNCEGLCWYNTK